MKRLALVLLFVVMAAPAALAQTPWFGFANLSGANEVPPADPDGSGTALITITGTTVAYQITANLIDAPSAQHIHIGPAGVNGPVVVGLTGVWTGSGQGPWTLTGSVTTDAATAAAIIANPAGFYVNVHNAPFPGGAIRGQLATSGTVPTASTWALLALTAMLAIGGVLLIRRF